MYNIFSKRYNLHVKFIIIFTAIITFLKVNYK